MKPGKIFLCIIILTCSQLVAYTQDVTVGIQSGINISDIHGRDINGEWHSRPGFIQSLYLKYSISDIVGIQTGIDYHSIMYEHPQDYYRRYYGSSGWPSVYDHRYYLDAELMNFNYLRFPLLLDLKIPTKLILDLRAGLYFSLLTDYSLCISSYYVDEKIKPATTDIGLVISSGISFPVNENTMVVFDAGYVMGRKQFLPEYRNYRHGASEFKLGVAYTFKKGKGEHEEAAAPDTSSGKIQVTYMGGATMSWNSSTVKGKRYSVIPGPSLGFALNIPVGERSFLKPGFSYNRKGYSLSDSSNLFYRYSWGDDLSYFCDTKVQTDYAIVPLLFSFPVTRSDLIFIDTGPWIGFIRRARNSGVAWEPVRTPTSYTLRKIVINNDISPLLKDYDFGWIAGCGISYPLKDYTVEFMIRYSMGFMDIFDPDQADDLETGSDDVTFIRNNTLSFQIGLRLPPPVR